MSRIREKENCDDYSGPLNFCHLNANQMANDGRRGTIKASKRKTIYKAAKVSLSLSVGIFSRFFVLTDFFFFFVFCI